MTPRNRPAPGPSRILVVCTGNLCRSPLIERILRDRLDRSDVAVTSAGTLALEGDPMEPSALLELERLGVDGSGFGARHLEAAQVEEADLVLVAAREHRAAVVTLVPTAAARTFTLGEVARLLEDVPADAGLDPGDLALLAAERRGRTRTARRGEDDLADPYRRNQAAFTRCVAEIERLLEPVVARLRDR